MLITACFYLFIYIFIYLFIYFSYYGISHEQQREKTFLMARVFEGTFSHCVGQMIRPLPTKRQQKACTQPVIGLIDQAFRRLCNAKRDTLGFCNSIVFQQVFLIKSIAGRYRSVSYPDGPITTRYRFMFSLV